MLTGSYSWAYSLGDPISETFSPPPNCSPSGKLGGLVVTPRGTVCLREGCDAFHGCLNGQDLVKLGAPVAKRLLPQWCGWIGPGRAWASKA